MLNKVALFLLALIPNGYVIGAWLGLGSFTHLLFTLVVGIVLIKLMHSGFKVSRPSKIDLYLLLLVSYMLLSTLQLSDPKDGFLKFSISRLPAYP
ncbi:hypothetical protein [Bacillus sp. JCM 19041]|uniref:hypothetical protein n=1 Tax=Bacillus sp. JCM 19041 TaxID=1460637 RepID=UPI0006D11424